ncbi:MAG: hypothetical protein ACLPHP_15310 [Candidatus Sulfotelmatobacter sp.]
MSFDVFASGSGGFHYQRDRVVDGDDFDALKIASELQAMDPTKLGAADAVRGHFLSKDMTDAISAIAQREFLYSLNEQVDLLSIRGGAADRVITVTAKQKHAVWPDTIRYAEYAFNPGNSPGTEFVRVIAQSLDDTGLKTWGVLMALTIVLSKFSEHLDSCDASVLTKINIFLTH